MSGPGLVLPPSDPRVPVLNRVRPPAFMLMAVGMLNILFNLAGLVFALFKIPSPLPPPPGEPPFVLELTTGFVVWILASSVCAAVSIWGALNAMRLRGYAMAIMGALTATFPLSPTCIAGVVIAPWMFFTLLKPEVRKVFQT